MVTAFAILAMFVYQTNTNGIRYIIFVQIYTSMSMYTRIYCTHMYIYLRADAVTQWQWGHGMGGGPTSQLTRKITFINWCHQACQIPEKSQNHLHELIAMSVYRVDTRDTSGSNRNTTTHSKLNIQIGTYLELCIQIFTALWYHQTISCWGWSWCLGSLMPWCLGQLWQRADKNVALSLATDYNLIHLPLWHWCWWCG